MAVRGENVVSNPGASNYDTRFVTDPMAGLVLPR
jgi:hypothetical protein